MGPPLQAPLVALVAPGAEGVDAVVKSGEGNGVMCLRNCGQGRSYDGVRVVLHVRTLRVDFPEKFEDFSCRHFTSNHKLYSAVLKIVWKSNSNKLNCDCLFVCVCLCVCVCRCAGCTLLVCVCVCVSVCMCAGCVLFVCVCVCFA